MPERMDKQVIAVSRNELAQDIKKVEYSSGDTFLIEDGVESIQFFVPKDESDYRYFLFCYDPAVTEVHEFDSTTINSSLDLISQGYHVVIGGNITIFYKNKLIEEIM